MKLPVYLNLKSDCTGCGACYSICPFDSIKMLRDEEGFEYPVVEESCRHCGLCANVCPQINREKLDFIGAVDRISPQFYKALTRSHDVWTRSSSGGAFYEICRKVPIDAVLFGAEMDGVDVHHSYFGFDEIDKLMRSKYVQSSIGASYKNVKAFIDAGRYVVFSGTPCQIAGLLMFLKERPKNLLTVEFICHGVGSPDVFARSINECADREGRPIQTYFFREKTEARNSKGYSSKIVFSDGTSKVCLNDDYNVCFLAQLAIRPSCGEYCKYRNSCRNADITLADLKGEALPDIRGNLKDSSVIVANTTAGRSLVEKLDMDIGDYAEQRLMKFNPLFFHTMPSNSLRNKFFREYLRGRSVHYLRQRFVNIPVLKRKLFAFPRRLSRKLCKLFRLG